MELFSTDYYLDQCRDENGTEYFEVIQSVSRWVNGWPKDVVRKTVLTLEGPEAKDAARAAVHVFNANIDSSNGMIGRDSVVKHVSRCIGFFTDNDTNRVHAESINQFPAVY